MGLFAIDPIRCVGCVEEKSTSEYRWQCMGCSRCMKEAPQDRYITASNAEIAEKERLTVREQLTVNLADYNGERTIEFRDNNGKVVWTMRA